MTLWIAIHQAPLSLGFSRQQYWSGFPCPLSGDLPNQGIKPVSPLKLSNQPTLSLLAPPHLYLPEEITTKALAYAFPPAPSLPHDQPWCFPWHSAVLGISDYSYCLFNGNDLLSCWTYHLKNRKSSLAGTNTIL